MGNSKLRTYGLSAYLDVAGQIAARKKKTRSLVLLRILAAKALYGLSANEYALFSLDGKPFSHLASYRNKKQTTALFDRVNPHAERSAVEDKLSFHRLCLQAGLPVPHLHAVLSLHDASTIPDFPTFLRFEEMLDSIAHLGDAELILKPRCDALGTGIRFVKRREGQLFDISGKLIEIGEFTTNLYLDMQRDDYLVQEFIHPHKILSEIGNGKALGTLRIVSWLEKDTVKILYALLRIPCAENASDNFLSGATGNLIANVDPATGCLGSVYGRRQMHYSRLLDRYDSNPDTNQQISGTILPGWDRICEIVHVAATRFGKLPLLGWDIAISERDVTIIEANSNPDIIGAQICTNFGARELLKPVYQFVH